MHTAGGVKHDRDVQAFFFQSGNEFAKVLPSTGERRFLIERFDVERKTAAFGRRANRDVEFVGRQQAFGQRCEQAVLETVGRIVVDRIFDLNVVQLFIGGLDQLLPRKLTDQNFVAFTKLSSRKIAPGNQGQGNQRQ